MKSKKSQMKSEKLNFYSTYEFNQNNLLESDYITDVYQRRAVIEENTTTINSLGFFYRLTINKPAVLSYGYLGTYEGSDWLTKLLKQLKKEVILINITGDRKTNDTFTVVQGKTNKTFSKRKNEYNDLIHGLNKIRVVNDSEHEEYISAQTKVRVDKIREYSERFGGKASGAITHFLTKADGDFIHNELKTLRQQGATDTTTKEFKYLHNILAYSLINYLVQVHKNLLNVPKLFEILTQCAETHEEQLVLKLLENGITQKLSRDKRLMFTVRHNNTTFDYASLLTEFKSRAKITEGLLKKTLEMSYNSHEMFLKQLVKVNEERQHGMEGLLSADKEIHALLFYSNEKVDLVKASKITDVYVDGTIRPCPFKNTQLLVLSVKQEHSKTTPVIYALMKSKTADSYEHVFRIAMDKLGLDANTHFHCDFENALLIAGSALFRVIPCYYHYCQLLMKKRVKIHELQATMRHFVNKNSQRITLRTLYKQYIEINCELETSFEVRYEFLNVLKCMAFLEPAYHNIAFVYLNELAENGLERVYLAYFKAFFAKYERYFPIRRIQEVTNNIAESYFSTLNQNFTRKPGLFLFIKGLINTDKRMPFNLKKPSKIKQNKFDLVMDRISNAKTPADIERLFNWAFTFDLTEHLKPEHKAQRNPLALLRKRQNANFNKNSSAIGFDSGEFVI